MLPMLKDKKEASIALPSDSIQREPDEEQEYDFMESAAEDLCHAITSKDYKAIAEALRAAFDIMESQPHEEGPHI